MGVWIIIGILPVDDLRLRHPVDGGVLVIYFIYTPTTSLQHRAHVASRRAHYQDFTSHKACVRKTTIAPFEAT